MRQVLEHVVHGALALFGAVGGDVDRLAARVGVVILAAPGATGAKEARGPAAEERTQGGHGAGHDGEVAFDGGPDVGDVVVGGLVAEEEELVHVDETDDGDNGNAGD